MRNDIADVNSIDNGDINCNFNTILNEDKYPDHKHNGHNKPKHYTYVIWDHDFDNDSFEYVNKLGNHISDYQYVYNPINNTH